MRRMIFYHLGRGSDTNFLGNVITQFASLTQLSYEQPATRGTYFNLMSFIVLTEHVEWRAKCTSAWQYAMIRWRRWRSHKPPTFGRNSWRHFTRAHELMYVAHKNCFPEKRSCQKQSSTRGKGADIIAYNRNRSRHQERYWKRPPNICHNSGPKRLRTSRPVSSGIRAVGTPPPPASAVFGRPHKEVKLRRGSLIRAPRTGSDGNRNWQFSGHSVQLIIRHMNCCFGFSRP